MSQLLLHRYLHLMTPSTWVPPHAPTRAWEPHQQQFKVFFFLFFSFCTGSNIIHQILESLPTPNVAQESLSQTTLVSAAMSARHQSSPPTPSWVSPLCQPFGIMPLALHFHATKVTSALASIVVLTSRRNVCNYRWWMYRQSGPSATACRLVQTLPSVIGCHDYAHL